MIQSRYREKGPGAVYNYRNIDIATGTLYYSVEWTFPRTGSWNPKPAPLPSKTFVFSDGSQIVVDPPQWLKGSSDWYLDNNSQVYLDYITEKFSVTPAPSGSGGISLLESDSGSQMTDVVGSGFKKNQGKRFIVNPCDSSSRDVKVGSIKVGTDASTAVCNYGNQTETYSSNLVVVTWSRSANFGLTESGYSTFKSLLPQSYISTASYEYLYSNAVGKIQDAELDVLTALAELDKTVSFIVGSLRSIGFVIRQVRRGDFSFIKDFKSLSPRERWLEARYAVRPLIIDAENLIRALATDGKLAPTLSKRAAESDGSLDALSFSFTADGFSYEFEGWAESHITARAGAYARLGNDLATIYKFGLSNIATTAWEVVPWSFVINWFVDVSGLISSLNPNPVYNLEAGYLSLKQESYITGFLSITRNGQTESVPIRYSSSDYSRLKKDDPALISFNLNLSVPKLVDLLAFTSYRI